MATSAKSVARSSGDLVVVYVVVVVVYGVIVVFYVAVVVDLLDIYIDVIVGFLLVIDVNVVVVASDKFIAQS